MTQANTVYGTLKNWDLGEFVPVSTSNGCFYGGYQVWLTDQGVSLFFAERSCSVTAAANMLYYMSQNIGGKAKLYTRTGISKSSFNAFQKDVYDYISPAVWGVLKLNKMIRRVEKFAYDQGVSLSATKISAPWNEINVRNYISEGLNKECPVLILTWNSPISDLNMHWVTVSRLYDSDSGIKMVTSNWAEKKTYDFSTWVNGPSISKGAVYFE